MIQFNVPVKYSFLLMTGNCGPQSCFFFYSSAFFSPSFPITLKIKHRPSSYIGLHQKAYWLQFCGFRVLKVYPYRIGCNIRFFDHFQLPSCEGNNKCQSLRAQRKPSWHWMVVIILFPPHSETNFVFVRNNKWYSVDMNVVVPFSTFQLWHLKAVPLELKVKEKLYHMLHSGEKKTPFQKSFYSRSPIIFLDFHFLVIWVTQAIGIGLVCCQVSSVNNFTI